MAAIARALLVLALLSCGTAAAQPPDDDFAPLDLASMLVRDGKFDRAEKVLADVDEADDDLDRVRFYTIRGLMRFTQERFDDAAADLERAVAAGQQELQVHLYLAQAWFELERMDRVVAVLDRADALVGGLASAQLMKAQALWSLGEPQRAIDALAAAATRIPGNPTFARRQVAYLVELALYGTAADLASRTLASADAKPDEYAAAGAALRRTRAFDDALLVLEVGALRHPGSVAIAKQHAQTLLESGRPLNAAEVLARAAEREPALLSETAELFRRAGAPVRALAWNARIGDGAKKLRQRVGILAELRRFDQIAAMESALARAGLLADEDIRYALAYASYRGGDFDASERHLGAISRADLVRKATELRSLMAACTEARWTCA
ncbi:MAG TPA: tetratricopeptide repeat protein [Xanthomonadales bacterium]|nr:tetratricopeptide repeat protein [Xanthomonadales bacterium]